MKGGAFFTLFIYLSGFLFVGSLLSKPLMTLEPKVRVIPKQMPISVLDLALIRPYLSQNLIVSPSWLDTQFLVIGSDEPSALFRENDIIYIDGVLPKGALLGIYQQGREFVLSYSKQVEQEVILAASGLVIESDSISTVKVLSSFREIQLGDVILVHPSSVTMPSYFIPKVSKLNSPAVIIASETKMTAMGMMDVVYLDQGRLQGVMEGHLLSIFAEGEPATLIGKGQVVRLHEGTAYDKMMASYDWDRTFVMPRFYAGQLMIFKVFENMSFGIIIENQKPIRVGDSVGDR
ncbi:peptidoglycan-binding protein LysM [uncultured Shewanella sp.]|uniref:peptidoglycan-binding protein LysM n=1 Tax=uncultured Shewanella sp. TaxID=173975 RepID=UPI002607DAA1|nr:peptidoglycan-binding protein LysM [uncultured Shewanella sp.]